MMDSPPEPPSAQTVVSPDPIVAPHSTADPEDEGVAATGPACATKANPANTVTIDTTRHVRIRSIVFLSYANTVAV